MTIYLAERCADCGEAVEVVACDTCAGIGCDSCDDTGNADAVHADDLLCADCDDADRAAATRDWAG